MPSNSKMSRRKTLFIKLSFGVNLCVALYIAVQYLDNFVKPERNSHSSDNSVSHQRTLNSITNAAAEKLSANQTLVPTTMSSVSSWEPKTPIVCHERDTKPKKAMRGQYWALYNYIPGSRRFKCNETITYTTHCDHTFLDNVVPLLKRWQGPISISLYTPGSDYEDALKAVAYYR